MFASGNLAQDFSNDAQCTGTGDGLVLAYAVRVVAAAEDEFGHTLVVVVVTVDADVFFCGLPLPDALFGCFDGAHDRRLSRGVLEDANANVNFFGTWIVAAQFGQFQDGIIWQFFDVFKHGFSFFWLRDRDWLATGRGECAKGGRRGYSRPHQGSATIGRFPPGRK